MNFLFLSPFSLIPLALSKERHYYIKAEEILWDYAPGFHPHTKSEKTFLENSDDRIGKVYKKCVYRRYTDDDFEERHPEDDRSPGSKWEHLGFLGPVLRSVVGDRIFIHFKNMCHFPATVHVHGFRYSKKDEGSNYLSSDYRGGEVPPGEKFTYDYEVEKRSGPTKHDPSTIAWYYHSHVDEPIDTNTGLVGILIVGRNEDDAPNGKPKGVDKEFINHYSIIDENLSRYLDYNIEKFTEVDGKKDISHLKKDLKFIESNKKSAINGYLYFTLPGLDMHLNDKVRWYLVALGSESDLHTAHWHGNTATFQGGRVDVVDITPGMTSVADMKADAPGTWMVHCHVNDHIDDGMLAVYRVKGDDDHNDSHDDDHNDSHDDDHNDSHDDDHNDSHDDDHNDSHDDDDHHDSHDDDD